MHVSALTHTQRLIKDRLTAIYGEIEFEKRWAKDYWGDADKTSIFGRDSFLALNYTRNILRKLHAERKALELAAKEIKDSIRYYQAR